MKRFALSAALCAFAATPAAAEEGGVSLMERGAQMFLEGILREVEPALKDLEELGPMLRGFVEEMGPALGDLLGEIEDWSLYHPPEFLPNGDIILRRKTDEERAVPDTGRQSEPVDI